MLVEHLFCKQKVRGSIPLVGPKLINKGNFMDLCEVKHVIISDNYINKCSCGKVATMKLYRAWDEASHVTDPSDERLLAICECGNIFICHKV